VTAWVPLSGGVSDKRGARLVPLGGCKDLPGGSNGSESYRRGLQGVRYGIRVENWSWAE